MIKINRLDKDVDSLKEYIEDSNNETLYSFLLHNESELVEDPIQFLSISKDAGLKINQQGNM